MLGVGGTSLTVDRCGNFYAVLGALTEQDLDETQPFVQNLTVHRMEKNLAQQNNRMTGWRTSEAATTPTATISAAS